MEGPSNELIQMVDGDGNFISMETFNEKIQRWGFLEKAFDYYIVAVLGAQSSGKSTLLNLLFGTKFQTLEAHEGRVQVTKGIWMGVSLRSSEIWKILLTDRHNKRWRFLHPAVILQDAGISNLSKTHSEKEETILVFDVEGVDGRERGESEQSFERKTSLFSLALAEVLMVNMWHTDVGRYNAGNIALLKTVFEQHLLLFGKSKKDKKTHIMFVIRDHLAEETPLEKLKTIIMKDMNGIWDNIQKGEDFANTKASDFFDFSFIGLSHKVLMPTKFAEGVENLRKRFVDAKAADFILDKGYQNDIPADGLAPYANRVWQTIKENKDLDLPSQKEMLAMFRCDEIMEGITKEFNQTIVPLKGALDRGYVEDFGKKISDLYHNSLAKYDGPASRYHQDVAQRKRALLAGTMSNELYALYVKQLQKLFEKTQQFFHKLVEEGIPPGDTTATKEFASLIKSIVESSYEYFESRAKDSLLKGSDWSYQTEFDEIKAIIQKQVDVVKEQELKKLMEEQKTFFNTHMIRPLDKFMDNPSPDMWSNVRKLYDSAKEKALANLQERLKGFQIEGKEADKRTEELKRLAFEVLKDKFKSKAKFINYILSKKFEEAFNLDEKGLPRRWKQTDNVKETFLQARTTALAVLEQYAFLRLDDAQDSVKFLETGEDNIPEPQIIISNEECQQVKDKFEKETNTSYLQALRDQEHVASAAHVPMYIILLIMILGFNEFIHVLTSPILLFLTIVLGITGYVLYILNMMGPAKRVMEALLHTSLSTLQQWVSEQMSKPAERERERDRPSEPIRSSTQKPKDD